MLNVRFKATFLLSQLTYISMKARGYGRIINISSNLAYKGAPGLAHYSAAKAAVLGFTRSLAQEAAPHGVLVNAIAPGPIDTRLNDTLSPEWKAWKGRQSAYSAVRAARRGRSFRSPAGLRRRQFLCRADAAPERRRRHALISLTERVCGPAAAIGPALRERLCCRRPFE
jgi:NAD(P)-dependent dehydrogenase (short-subunit alcohol dehydrogenase family)